MTEPDLSCKYISIAQAKLRRIREWADDHGELQVGQWAHDAYEEIEQVRDINKQLRRLTKRRQRKAERD